MSKSQTGQDKTVLDRQKLARHVAEVWNLFHEGILPLFPAEAKRYIHLNEDVLAACLGRALSDLRRMADFHLPNSAPDRHKYAAFLADGIARGKPMYWEAGQKLDRRALITLHYINDFFAVAVFRSFLASSLPHELFGHLVYMLHYRSTHAKSLSLIAYMCEQLTQERDRGSQVNSQ
jgi:hypothetical protein